METLPEVAKSCGDEEGQIKAIVEKIEAIGTIILYTKLYYGITRIFM